jgi:hypothetical protein
MDNATGELVNELENHVSVLHTPVQDFLDLSPEDCNHAVIPPLLHSLDGLISFFELNIKGKIPLQTFRNYIQKTTHLQNETAAVYQAFLRNTTSTNCAAGVALPQGGSRLDIKPDLLKHLLDLGYSNVVIAQHLGCSCPTVMCRRKMLQPTGKRQAKHLVNEDTLREVSCRPLTLSVKQISDYLYMPTIQRVRSYLNTRGQTTTVTN